MDINKLAEELKAKSGGTKPKRIGLDINTLAEEIKNTKVITPPMPVINTKSVFDQSLKTINAEGAKNKPVKNTHGGGGGSFANTNPPIFNSEAPLNHDINLSSLFNQSLNTINTEGSKGKQTIQAMPTQTPEMKQQLFKIAMESGLEGNTYFQDPNFDFQGYKDYHSSLPLTERLKNFSTYPLDVTARYDVKKYGELANQYMNDAGIVGDVASGVSKGVSGIETAFRGWGNAITGDLGGDKNFFKEDPLATSYNTARQGEMDNRSFVRNLPENLSTIFTQLAPTLATGGTAGLAIAGGIAGGQNAQDALNNGATPWQATGHGLVTGTAEALTERMFGFKFKNGAKVLSDGALKFTGGAVRNAKTIAKEFAKKSIGEGLEEVIIEPVTQVSKKSFYDKTVNTKGIFDETGYLPLKRMAESGALGAIMGGILSGANIPNQVEQARQIQKDMGKNLKNDVLIGLNMPKNSASFAFANKLANETLETVTNDSYQHYQRVLKPDIQLLNKVAQENAKTPQVQPNVGIESPLLPQSDFTPPTIPNVKTPSQLSESPLNEVFTGQNQTPIPNVPNIPNIPDVQNVQDIPNVPSGPKTSMDDRFISEVGNKKINAYQYDNPEVKPIFQDISQYILHLELVKAKGGWNGDYERGMQGDVIRKLKETGLSYNEIERGLQLIIKDEGSENVASAKKIEIVLDELLSQGFKGINGEVWDSHPEYLKIKSMIEGKTYEPKSNDFNVEGLPDVEFAQPVIQPPLQTQTNPLPTQIKPQEIGTKPQESVIKPQETVIKPTGSVTKPTGNEEVDSQKRKLEFDKKMSKTLIESRIQSYEENILRKRGFDKFEADAVKQSILHVNDKGHTDIVEEMLGIIRTNHPNMFDAKDSIWGIASSRTTATNKQDVKTGEPFNSIMYNGKGKSASEIYNYIEYPILGTGKYYTFTEEHARYYGDNITSKDVSLENPFVISDDGDWRNLTRASGWEYPNPYGGDTSKIKSQIDKLKEMVLSKNYDGIIVNFEDYVDGDINSATNNSIKLIRNMFAHDQVVVYNESEEQEPVQAKQDEQLPENIDTTNTNNEPSPQSKLASKVQNLIGAKFSNADLFKLAEEAYGGTQAQGKFTVKDAHDGLELGFNMYLLDRYTTRKINNLYNHTMRSELTFIENLLTTLPTQGRNRTDEMIKYQQFSTPPNISLIANWLSDTTTNDVVLEPSAGIGGLALFAKGNGATVYVNELSKRRLQFIKELPFDGFFNENAEHIDNVLPDNIKPTVIIMNPPFSATAGRMGDKKNSTQNATRHIEQALSRLEEGGRLVAIVGNGMAHGKPAFKKWWKEIESKYNVRANVTLDGKNYEKYGTTFDVNLFVIDKTGSTTEPVKTGIYTNLDDVLTDLEGIKDERSRARDNKDKPKTYIPTSEETTKEPEGNKPISSPSDTGTVKNPTNPNDRPEKTPTRTDGQVGESKPNNATTSTNNDTRPTKARTESGTTDNTTSEVGDTRPTKRDGEGTNRQPDRELSDGIDKGIKTSNKKDNVDKVIENEDDVYSKYKPSKLLIEGAKPHITDLVESGAMSAVNPPDVTYSPNLPKELITSGKLSIAQLENIVYSGQAHEQKLPDGKRKGYFIGDGTGVGKGRQVAGIILDNFRNGRKKAVWVSNNPKLIVDAKRDWEALGQDAAELRDIRKYKLGTNITDKEGVVFVSYTTLKSNARTDLSKSRLNQLVDWFGKDYDGVIVFDESHNMGNATDSGKGLKKTKASKQALAGVELQNLLPNSRIVYASATGATKVDNLAYLTRLGLWGEGTAFSSVIDFINKISLGGLSAMELVARDMKSLGVYLARSLSFKGVDYETIQHTLTPIQTEIYDTISRGWQEILKDVDSVLVDTGADGRARGQAKSQFYSSMQRFYNQIITSMAMPSVIKDIKQQLADGHSVVIQLVNTNQASTDRQLADTDIDTSDLDNIDLTPTDIIINYLEKSFPVYEYEKWIDENGNEQSRIVLDSNDQPVINRVALAKKNKLIEKVKEMKVPDGALEMLFDEFGAEKVAEVTGRDQRVVAKMDANGNLKRVLEKRNEKSNLADAQAFQNADKMILVFSDAGGTGASYHADRNAKNKTKRVHYLLQPGWNAFKATQGFGRTHRAGQVQPPLFKLVTTNIMGQKRFTSTIAKRLDQLGALTKGQRQTGSGAFGAKDNLESDIGQIALREFYKYIDKGTIKKLGLGDKLLDEYDNYKEDFAITTNIGMFLNRILALEVEHQNETFNNFYSIFEDTFDKAIENGTLDTGLENYIAEKIEVIDEKVINTDKNSGAETTYIQLKAYQKPIILTYDAVENYKDKFQGLVKITDTGEVRALYKGRNKTTSKGEIVPTYYLIATNPMKQSVYQQSTLDEVTTKIPKAEWKKVWNESIKGLPEFQEETLHMLSGTLLPIWNKLPESNAKVKRVMADDGSQYLGRIISANEIDGVLRKFNLDRVKETFEPAGVIKRILEGETAKLEENKTKLSRRRVSGEYRIEITGQNTWQYGRIEGVYEEIIASSRRYFIPTGTEGIPVLERILKNNPITEMTKEYKDSNEDVLSFSQPNAGNKGYPSSNGEANINDAISPTEMVQKFADRFEDVFIRKGKPNSRNAIADFNTRTYVTRLRKSNDIPSLSHEMAHYLDVKFKIIIQMSPSKMMELSSDFRDTQSDKMPLNVKASESFAEVVRSYLVGEIDFYNNHYQKFVIKNLEKKELDFLDEMRGYITNFINLKARDRVRKTVYAEGDKRPKAKFSYMEALEGAFTGFVDEHRPVTRTAMGLGGKKGAQLIKEYIAQLRGYKSTASFNINASSGKGYYQSNLKGENVGKSLSEIVKPLVDSGYDVEDSFWREYAVARRAMDYKERKLEMPLPYKDYVDTIEELEREHPEFEEIFEDIQLYKKNLMQLLVDSGLKTQKQIDDIIELNPNHMHLFRVMDNAGGTGSGKIGNVKNPLKQLKGSGRDIVDPYESLIKMTYLYWNIARRQEVMTQLASLEKDAVGKGIWLSKADIKIIPKKLKTDEVAQVVKAYFTQLFDQTGSITEADLEGLRNDVDASKTELGSLAQVLFEISHRAKENQVIIHINGKPVVYDINPELYKAIVQHDPIFTNTLVRVLVGIGNFQAKTIMIKPTFPVFTAIREIGTDLLMTRTGMTPLDIMKAYINVIGGNAVWRSFEMRGGTNEVYFAKDGIFEKEEIKKIRASKTKLDKLKHKAKSPFETSMDVLKILDVSPKLAEYTRGLENDGYFKVGLTDTIKEAYKNRTEKRISSEFLLNQAQLMNTPASVHRNNVWKARDISYDIGKTGSLVRQYQVNSIWRFSKAQLQGVANLGKVVYDKDVRKNFLVRGAMMTMFTMALYALLRENDYYKELEDWKKDGYWWLPIGDPKTTESFIAIPKPFQEALLFSTVPERVLRSMESDSYVSKRAFDNLMGTVRSTFFPETTPMVFGPLMENMLNEQWNGIPIENMSDRLYKLPEDRYNEYTSQVAINIAKLTKYIPLLPDSFKSPKMIDNFLVGYTNAVGQTALTTIDATLGEKQPSEIWTSSGITNLGVRDISRSNKSVNEFYETRGKLTQETNSMEEKFKTEKPDKKTAQSYYSKKALLKEYNKASKTLTLLTKVKKDAVKKRNKELEKDIQNKIVKIVQTVNGMADKLNN